MATLRDDNKISISPSELIGSRNNIRTEAPKSLDPDKVSHFIKIADKHAVAVLEAARNLGVRAKEAVMLDYHNALKEAKKYPGIISPIKISEGTKGGRGHCPTIQRFVPVTKKGLEIIEKNALLQGNRKNIIPNGKNWKQMNNELRKHSTRDYFHQAGLKDYHDARSAYACDRYKEITHKDAPCISGHRQASKYLDRKARHIIANELGHSRIDICTSYIGSSR